MPASKSIDRLAIVIIHGIGEQRPMATLRSFASAIPKIERNPGSAPAWSKPDKISEGFEHRCFTIPQTRTRPITDVYELYWAHLFEQTKLTTLAGWLWRLLKRPRSSLPKRYRRPVLMVRSGFGLALVLAVIGGRLLAHQPWVATLLALPLVPLAYAGLVGLLRAFALDTISDAARYLDANPRNVEARNKVRQLGLGFLDRLHASDKGYSRIILCGHSLGSVIGYDILQRYWFTRSDEFKPLASPDQDVQKRMGKLAKAKKGQEFRELQRSLWVEQRACGNGWRITDFVTMGSPLAHADLLMAETEDEFRAFLHSGELSACPPRVDPVSGDLGRPADYRLEDGQRRTMFTLRDNAVFAPTRWTNLYFKTRFGLFGDAIAGPVAGLFGPAVVDYGLEPVGGKWFAHCDYWLGGRPEWPPTNPPATALEALSLALELDLKVILGAEPEPKLGAPDAATPRVALSRTVL